MRTKDREILLKRAIMDVASQSFPSWELIIVNDGGAPKPVDALLERYASALKGRARVIHNAQSQGMEHASNQAISDARGAYICVHDDDDTWAPSFLERTVGLLEEHPEYAGVAVRTEIVLERIEGNRVVELGREPAWPEIHQFSLTELMSQNIAVPIGCLYRAAVISELGGFRDDLPVVGDWEFHLRLAVAHDVAYIDGHPLAFWHQRRAQRGVMGNSVFAGANDHAYFDLKVRDEYLREYAQAHGVGALLFIASMSKRSGGAGGGSALSTVKYQAQRGTRFFRSRWGAAQQQQANPVTYIARDLYHRLIQR